MSDDTTDRWERGAAKINEVYAGNVFPIPKGTMPFYDRGTGQSIFIGPGSYNADEAQNKLGVRPCPTAIVSHF